MTTHDIPGLIAEAERLADAPDWTSSHVEDVLRRLSAALAAEHERAERAVGIAKRNGARVEEAIAAELTAEDDRDALARQVEGMRGAARRFLDGLDVLGSVDGADAVLRAQAELIDRKAALEAALTDAKGTTDADR